MSLFWANINIEIDWIDHTLYKFTSNSGIHVENKAIKGKQMYYSEEFSKIYN